MPKKSSSSLCKTEQKHNAQLIQIEDWEKLFGIKSYRY